MKHILLLLVLTLSLVGQLAHGQARVVQGVVRDAQGPVPGVSVYEKDLMSNGIATDAEGKYRLTLKGKNGVLVFRSVSYKLSEVQVGTRPVVNVTLESSEQTLNEVTVVGFGEQRKITQTGSVSQVSGVAIRENPSASLQNSLVGRLPGFFAQQPSGRPGADGANFFIRGISSYNGNSQPLIIVDDIQYSYDQFQRLDPNEIESLSILKDAATTAIYGVRGANGVVVVTTRRGKNGPPQISARVEGSLSQPTKITHYLDAYQTASLYNQAQINDNAASPSPTFKPRFTDDDLQKFKDGSDPYGHPNVDWRKVLFKNFSQQYRANLDIQGGSERVKYFISGGYLFQNGMLKDFGDGQGVNNNYYHRRTNYRSNLDINVARGLDMRIDLYGNFAQVNTPSVGSPFSYNDVFFDYSSFLTLAPFAYPIYNPDGSYGYSIWQRDVVGSNYNNNNVVGRLTNYGYDRNNENNINSVLSLKQDLGVFSKGLQGLSVTGRVAYTSNYYYTRSTTRDAFPSFIYDPATDTYQPRDPNLFRTRRFFLGYNGRSTSRTVNVQGLINYDRTFGKHHASGLLLYNRNSVSAGVGGLYNFIPANFLGYSLRMGYDYDARYLFEINAGYNGSDRFSSKNRYGLFPAVSVGWNIAEESFFHNALPVVDMLKVRGSYGLVGNDALGRDFSYYYQQNYSASSGANFGTTSTTYNGVAEGTLANNNVTWEKEKKLNLGLDYRLVKNALSGSFDYFRNERFDILTVRGTVSSIFGQGLPPVNLGRVRNRGFEIDLGYQSPTSRNFSYSVRGQYSFAKNTILFQDEPNNQYAYQNYTGNSIGQQRVYIFDGFYNQADVADSNVPKPATGALPGDLKYKDLNGDGRIDAFDQKVTGFPSLPNTTFGLNLGVRYKGFSVSALLQGSRNFNVAAAAEAIKAFGANLTEVHTKAWTPELGDDARYPRMTLLGGISDPSNRSTFWQISGNFVRLKTAQINYDIPSNLLRKVGIPSARVYANGTNLLTWSAIDKLYDFDPEIALNASRVNYPPQRLINLGLSVTF
ncbi:TonB-dependent receptor [Hymenobacter sp. GOD-10R]|uniref:SusC/RagA family TonB-linked outer membrane protein n=1 Tax=Hymenobacter sp. GOD-10R TaxID=3093922 RepID=UPI002D772465|nr:TonB-dependent receptor [Hymenobacter sp. GOD-10R]WRQ28535.1 TonB-dependent receptor [Hymenobacter sp. GOD-10R]